MDKSEQVQQHPGTNTVINPAGAPRLAEQVEIDHGTHSISGLLSGGDRRLRQMTLCNRNHSHKRVKGRSHTAEKRTSVLNRMTSPLRRYISAFPICTVTDSSCIAWSSVHAWLLRLRTDFARERLPAPDPVLHMSAPVRRGAVAEARLGLA